MSTQTISITDLAAEELVAAGQSHSGRSSGPVFGGDGLKMHQLVMGLVEGSHLPEHPNPGEATIYVIKGRVELSSDGDSWVVAAGDLIVVPDGTHSLVALEDSAILLSSVRHH